MKASDRQSEVEDEQKKEINKLNTALENVKVDKEKIVEVKHKTSEDEEKLQDAKHIVMDDKTNIELKKEVRSVLLRND